MIGQLSNHVGVVIGVGCGNAASVGGSCQVPIFIVLITSVNAAAVYLYQLTEIIIGISVIDLLGAIQRYGEGSTKVSNVVGKVFHHSARSFADKPA